MNRTRSLVLCSVAALSVCLPWAGMAEAAPPATWVGGTGRWVGSPPSPGKWLPATTFNVWPYCPGSNYLGLHDIYVDGGDTGTSSNLMVDMVNLDADNVFIDAGDTLTILSHYTLVVVGDTIVNQGRIVIDTVGNDATQLLIHAAVMLSGGGEVLLDDPGPGLSASNQFIGSAPNPGHLCNVDNFIHGAGDLGPDFDIINRHAIVADGVNPLRVNPEAALLNTGTLRAAAGSTLRLRDGHYTNFEGLVDGLIVAEYNSVVQFDGATIEGGQMQCFGTGYFETADSGHLIDPDLSGKVIVHNADHLSLSGMVQNNLGSTIHVNSTGGTTDLFIPTTATLTGGGQIILSDDSHNKIRDNVGFDGYLNNINNVIQGAGDLGDNTLKMTNNGLIIADGTNPLRVDPRDGADGGMMNAGTMRAINGATLRLRGGTYTNHGAHWAGYIEALDGSLVQLEGAHITGGVVRTAGTGWIETADSGALDWVTLQGRLRVNNRDSLFLYNTFTNEAPSTVYVNCEEGDTTHLFIDETVALTGWGSIVLSDSSGNRIVDPGGLDGHLINQDNVIRGAGRLGMGGLQITNHGQIVADQSTVLRMQPGPLGCLNESLGVLRGTDGGELEIQGNLLVQNLGTLEALDNSKVTYLPGSVPINNDAGVLRLGTWRAISTGLGAVVTLRGEHITRIAENTEVVISGPGAVIQVDDVPIWLTLTDNDGTLRVLDGAPFPAGQGITNGPQGIIELGGGDFTGPGLANAGELYGRGRVFIRPVNTGLIRAAGGTLTIPNGIQGGSGTIQIDAGATLDISGPPAVQDSSCERLVHNGVNLNLGTKNILVSFDYTNAHWGLGNGFDPRTNIAGSGEVRAQPAITQALDGNVVGGSAHGEYVMNFGIVHVGDVVTRQYSIVNEGATGVGPASGLRLRGAVQTSVNGGHITDLRLSGSGVTPANFGPLAPGGLGGSEAASFDVTLTAAHAAPLVGQAVHLANNFDNVDTTILRIEGMVHNYASADSLKLDGNGTITELGMNHYLVDLGDAEQGDPNLAIELGIANDAQAPADNLGGWWELDAPDFDLTGFESFSGVGAAQTRGGFLIELDTAGIGDFTGSILLHCLSENASGYSEHVFDVELDVQGRVIPEPATLSLLGLCSAALLRRRRRGRAQ